MSLLISSITVFVTLAFFAFVINRWFNYKKVAVQSKGYAKVRAIYYLFLAFTALTGVLFLPQSLLNLFLAEIGAPALDLSQAFEYKWMMFAAFIGFAIAVVFIFKKQTINANKKVSDHLIEESRRKNKEIDTLKEQLVNTFSVEERIHLSTKINQLQAELKAYEQEIKTLKEQLEKYSPDIEIVKEANDLLKQEGVDAALDYLESINFKKTLKASQQHTKALLIKAGFYTIKNQHKKADKAFLQSIRLHRGFDNTISYANYLFDQNKFPDAIKQLLVLNLESETLTEHKKATVLRYLANAYQKNNQHNEAEKAYDKALEIFRALWIENPSVYLPDMAATLNNLAYLYRSDNRHCLKEAEKAYDEALGIRRSLSKENPHVHLPDIARTLNNLANLYRSDSRRLKEAEKAYNKALGIFRGLWKESPSAYLPVVATIQNNLGMLYRSDSRLKEAEKALNEALGIRETLAKDNPSAYLPDVAVTLNNLAIFYYSDKRLKEAESAYDKALEIRRALAKENSNAWGMDLATSLITGVKLINQPRKNLKEAREVLLTFKRNSKADKLLLTIDELEAK